MQEQHQDDLLLNSQVVGTASVAALPVGEITPTGNKEKYGWPARLGLIMENPALYLAEICQHIHEVFALNVTPSTVCRLLKLRDNPQENRGAFRAQCSNFSVDKFVWIDETGSDARSHARKYGYALRGLTPVTHRLHTRGYVRVSRVPYGIRNFRTFSTQLKSTVLYFTLVYFSTPKASWVVMYTMNNHTRRCESVTAGLTKHCF